MGGTATGRTRGGREGAHGARQGGTTVGHTRRGKGHAELSHGARKARFGGRAGHGHRARKAC